MVDWKSKFDIVISMCFTGNKSRVPGLDAELERVGLRPDIRMWNVPSPHEKLVIGSMRPVKQMILSDGFRNSGFGHYRAVKTARELGATRCLIVEDDIRFLRDVDLLAETVGTAPSAANVWLFDLLKRGSETTSDIRRRLEAASSGRWTTPTENPCSMACYGLDRKGMDHIIGCFEGAFASRWPLRIADHYFWNCWHNGTISFACAWPLACIQIPIGNLSNTAATFGKRNPNCQLNWYKELGMDLADYAT